eukprot:NODE_3003_length_1069_cov_26.858824_g2755_i0.p1 GENE.NODE_3003_length_1069_cov_26.858824_g2755_i0~~NODE_3003_length_1069_cov_26.858824_g2755_i0.p1  ORF type:complete len:171 (+),score=31.55 NODE_3003_length_1069_cov_26.858824_g2755_i0:51-515(+)
MAGAIGLLLAAITLSFCAATRAVVFKNEWDTSILSCSMCSAISAELARNPGRSSQETCIEVLRQRRSYLHVHSHYVVLARSPEGLIEVEDTRDMRTLCQEIMDRTDYAALAAASLGGGGGKKELREKLCADDCDDKQWKALEMQMRADKNKMII